MQVTFLFKKKICHSLNSKQYRKFIEPLVTTATDYENHTLITD